MGANTKIEWASHTMNLWWGCVEVSPLCDNCYAREWSKRYDRAKWGADEPRLAIKSCWADVLKWQYAAEKDGRIDRVFCGSMMDIFEKPMPVVDAKGNSLEITTDDLRRRLFLEVIPNCPNLLFLLLTKRPGNITKYIPAEWMLNPPKNVMFGTSVGNQETADLMIPQLLMAPGYKFLSVEPLLGPVDLHLTHGYYPDVRRLLHWVIVGGESGPKARAMHPNWVRVVRDQCVAARVPFLFKQWGEWKPLSTTDGMQLLPFGEYILPVGENKGFGFIKAGKSAAGRVLDGRTWDELPACAIKSVMEPA